jgi:hypothetical protein
MSIQISRRFVLSGLAVLTMFTFGACKKEEGEQTSAPKGTHEIGNPVKVGKLTYQVIDTEWRDVLDGALGQRIPKNQFLVVQVSVTNNDADEAHAPLLVLLDKDEKAYREEDKGDGLANWLGLIRTLGPGETQQGSMLFDVPAGSYRLQLSSGGDAESEKNALVNLPYKLTIPDAAPTPDTK